jgi:hypothetical protein
LLHLAHATLFKLGIESYRIFWGESMRTIISAIGVLILSFHCTSSAYADACIDAVERYQTVRKEARTAVDEATRKAFGVDPADVNTDHPDYCRKALPIIRARISSMQKLAPLQSDMRRICADRLRGVGSGAPIPEIIAAAQRKIDDCEKDIAKNQHASSTPQAPNTQQAAAAPPIASPPRRSARCNESDITGTGTERDHKAASICKDAGQFHKMANYLREKNPAESAYFYKAAEKSYRQVGDVAAGAEMLQKLASLSSAPTGAAENEERVSDRLVAETQAKAAHAVETEGGTCTELLDAAELYWSAGKLYSHWSNNKTRDEYAWSSEFAQANEMYRKRDRLIAFVDELKAGGKCQGRTKSPHARSTSKSTGDDPAGCAGMRERLQHAGFKGEQLEWHMNHSSECNPDGTPKSLFQQAHGGLRDLIRGMMKKN